MTGSALKGPARRVRNLAAAIILGLVLTTPAYGETLRFVFMGDSRASKDTETVCPHEPTFNKCALKALNSQILALAPRPAFVIFGGDMGKRGYDHGAYTFKEFKDLMKPVTDAGIKLYVVLGNHELYREITPPPPHQGYYKANQDEYQKVFADMPANGPAGYESLVYSFESPGKDCFFAVLDSYYLTHDIPDPASINGRVDDTQLTWLRDRIAQTRARHKFLFIHVPYYLITASNPDSFQDVSYTKLWQILDNHHFDIYFCGHSHLYARKTIDSAIKPFPPLVPGISGETAMEQARCAGLQWKNNVVQLICGTAGAEADSSAITPPGNAVSWNVHRTKDFYYYSVVDVEGPQVRVSSYGGRFGNYSLVDSFTVPPNTIPAVNSILLDGK